MTATDTPVPPEWEVTRPGRYDQMPAEIYHADPWRPGESLSSSGAKKLLPPSCPAIFRYRPDKPKRRFDLGTAAHCLVLGEGQPLHVIDAADWTHKKDRQEADEAREAGEVPVLTAQHDTIKAMAAELARHKTASKLLAPGSGLAEQSVFWAEPEFGITRRARIDWLPWGHNGLVILPDYKTAASADPDAFSRACANYGYHQQGDWYGAAVRFLMPGADVRYCFIVQEIDPPYLVECYYLHPADLDEGQWKNRQAMEIYRDCTATGIWPGYNPEQSIETIRLPRWARTLEDGW